MNVGKNEDENSVPSTAGYGEAKSIQDLETFYHQNSKSAVWFIAIFTGGLGLIFLLGFFSRMSHIDPDDLALLAIALLILAFTGLFLRFSLKPAVVLSDREFLVRRFFGVRRWKYDDITSLGVYNMKFHPKDARGRRMGTTLITEHLVVNSRDGRSKKLTLPTFGRNAQILASLARRTGLEIEALPDVDKTQSGKKSG